MFLILNIRTASKSSKLIIKIYIRILSNEQYRVFFSKVVEYLIFRCLIKGSVFEDQVGFVENKSCISIENISKFKLLQSLFSPYTGMTSTSCDRIDYQQNPPQNRIFYEYFWQWLQATL